MKTIVIACGSGIATSTVISMKLRELLEKNNIENQLIQCSISEVDDHLKDADLLVLSTKPSITYDVPTVTAISLITGIGANETCNQILEYLKD